MKNNIIGKQLRLVEFPQLRFGNPKLTIGKKYKIVDTDGSNYLIIDDENSKTSIGACRFEQPKNLRKK